MGVRLGGRTGPGWGHPSPGGPDGGDRESPCAVTGALQAVTGTTPGCSGGTPTAQTSALPMERVPRYGSVCLCVCVGGIVAPLCPESPRCWQGT